VTPFERWFSSDFAKALKDVPNDTDVLSSGFSIRSASWDRRAAYLLWVERGRPEAQWHAQTWPTGNPGADDFMRRRYETPPAATTSDPLADILGDAPDPMGDILG